MNTELAQFAQPWSMDCSYEQALEVKPLLEEMGYECIQIESHTEYRILVSNFDNISKQVTNYFSSDKDVHNRLYLGSFHKELLLAIAAMRTDGWHKGEALINKTTVIPTGCMVFIENAEDFVNCDSNKCYRKATAQEIIDYFRNDKRVFDVGQPVEENVEPARPDQPKIEIKLIELSVGEDSYTISPNGIRVHDFIGHHSVESLEAAIREYRKYFNSQSNG